jgi:hypothetical protein
VAAAKGDESAKVEANEITFVVQEFRVGREWTDGGKGSLNTSASVVVFKLEGDQ